MEQFRVTKRLSRPSASIQDKEPEHKRKKFRPSSKFQHLILNTSKSTAHTTTATTTSTAINDTKEGQLLMQTFSALEQVLAFNMGRSSSSLGSSHCNTFHRLQKSVENLTGRQFDRRLLEQLVAVWPHAFHLEPVWTTLAGSRIASWRISWPFDTENTVATLAETTSDNGMGMEEMRASAYDSTVFLMKKSTERKKEFEQRLQRVLGQLGSCDPFPRASLPPLPTANNSTAAIDETKSLGGDETPTKAWIGVLKKRSRDEDSPMTPTVAETGRTPKTPITPCSVLERVRMKQKQREMENKHRLSREELKQRALLSQLPRFIDMLDGHFTSAKRTALYMNEITKKLVESSLVPITEHETMQLIEVLVEKCPEWCALIKSEFGILVKLNRDVTRQDVLTKIQCLLHPSASKPATGAAEEKSPRPTDTEAE